MKQSRDHPRRCEPTISAARIPASFNTLVVLLGTPAGRPTRRSLGSNGVSSPPLPPGIFFTYSLNQIYFSQSARDVTEDSFRAGRQQNSSMPSLKQWEPKFIL